MQIAPTRLSLMSQILHWKNLPKAIFFILDKTIKNEKIIKGNYLIWHSSCIDGVGDEVMEIPKSFGLNVRGFGIFGWEGRSLRRHDVIPKRVTKPMWWWLNMSFLTKSKKGVKLLVSHEMISTSQFESHWEIGILITIVKGTNSKRWKKFNYKRGVRCKSIERKLK